MAEPLERKLPGARMPFGYRAFAKKCALMMREDPRAATGQAFARLALLAVAQTGWALDEALYRDWRRIPLRGPLFVIGHQRSGTTFLHRLLARDTTHARALSLQEMLLPAVSLQRAITRLGTIDRARGGKLAIVFARAQNRLFGPLDHVHRIRLDEVEEDEFVLWALFASAMCANDAPNAAESPALDELRHFHDWSQARQADVLGYYRACALKKLYRAGPGWLVAKNPAFTDKIPALVDMFPDARFVYLVRNPLETIPSRLSLVREIWRRRFPRFVDMSAQQVEIVMASSVNTYLAAERDLPGLPEDRKLVVRYDDLVRDPSTVIRTIYRQFELPGPDASLSAVLSQCTAERPEANGSHRYSLMEFGIDEDALRRQLAPVFARHGF